MGRIEITEPDRDERERKDCDEVDEGIGPGDKLIDHAPSLRRARDHLPF